MSSFDAQQDQFEKIASAGKKESDKDVHQHYAEGLSLLETALGKNAALDEEARKALLKDARTAIDKNLLETKSDVQQLDALRDARRMQLHQQLVEHALQFVFHMGENIQTAGAQNALKSADDWDWGSTVEGNEYMKSARPEFNALCAAGIPEVAVLMRNALQKGMVPSEALQMATDEFLKNPKHHTVRALTALGKIPGMRAESPVSVSFAQLKSDNNVRDGKLGIVAKLPKGNQFEFTQSPPRLHEKNPNYVEIKDQFGRAFYIFTPDVETLVCTIEPEGATITPIPLPVRESAAQTEPQEPAPAPLPSQPNENEEEEDPSLTKYAWNALVNVITSIDGLKSAVDSALAFLKHPLDSGGLLLAMTQENTETIAGIQARIYTIDAKLSKMNPETDQLPQEDIDFMRGLYAALTTGGLARDMTDASILINHYANGGGEAVQLEPDVYRDSKIVQYAMRAMEQKLVRDFADGNLHAGQSGHIDSSVLDAYEFPESEGGVDVNGSILPTGSLKSENNNLGLKNANNRFHLQADYRVDDEELTITWRVADFYDFENNPDFCTNIPIPGQKGLSIKIPDRLSYNLAAFGAAKPFDYTAQWESTVALPPPGIDEHNILARAEL